MMIAPVVSKIFSWKYIWWHLHKFLQHPDSEFRLHTHGTINCHVFSISWTTLTSQHLWVCSICRAIPQRLLMSFKLSWNHCLFCRKCQYNVEYKIQIFFCQSSKTGLAYSACLMVGRDCVHVSKGKVYFRLLYRRSSTSQPTLTEKSL